MRGFYSDIERCSEEFQDLENLYDDFDEYQRYQNFLEETNVNFDLDAFGDDYSIEW